jgi:hypothetical protein
VENANLLLVSVLFDSFDELLNIRRMRQRMKLPQLIIVMLRNDGFDGLCASHRSLAAH